MNTIISKPICVNIVMVWLMNKVLFVVQNKIIFLILRLVLQHVLAHANKIICIEAAIVVNRSKVPNVRINCICLPYVIQVTLLLEPAKLVQISVPYKPHYHNCVH